MAKISSGAGRVNAGVMSRKSFILCSVEAEVRRGIEIVV